MHFSHSYYSLFNRLFILFFKGFSFWEEIYFQLYVFCRNAIVIFVVVLCAARGLHFFLLCFGAQNQFVWWMSILLGDFFFLLSKMFLLKGKQMYAFEYCFCTSIVTMAPAPVQNHSFRGTVRRVRCRLSLQTYIYSKGLQGFSS